MFGDHKKFKNNYLINFNFSFEFVKKSMDKINKN